MKIYIMKQNYIRQLFLYLLLMLFFLGFYYDNNRTRIMISGIIAVSILISLIYQYFTCIIINEKGITYKSILKKYCLEWHAIEQIRDITRWNIRVPWIIILTSSDTKDLYAKKNTFNRKGKCITFPYDFGAVNEIKEHLRNIGKI